MYTNKTFFTFVTLDKYNFIFIIIIVCTIKCDTILKRFKLIVLPGIYSLSNILNNGSKELDFQMCALQIYDLFDCILMVQYYP